MEQTKQLVGWECPRCFIIHSPFSLSCGCQAKTCTLSETTVNFKKIELEFQNALNQTQKEDS